MKNKCILLRLIIFERNINFTMKPCDEYYDGPIEYYGDFFGKTAEEIDEFLKEERERMQKVELPEEYDGY